MTNRNPYPFPQLENDANFCGAKPSDKSMSRSYGSDEQDKLQLKEGDADPWQRLNAIKTLSSQRQEVAYYDPQAPKDSLDFVLKCQYDHHNMIMKSSAETLKQPETIGSDHGRVLKNRPVVPEPVTLETQQLLAFKEPRNASIHSAKGLAIESHHSEATNRGYSRKHDGGFYST